MDVYVRSRLTSGLVVAGVSVLIAAPAAPPQSAAPSAAPPVALAAQVQPLRQSSAQPLLAQSATPALTQPLNPIIQQINFNIAFVGDFLSTGAVLFGREFAIPGALLQDVKNGTPVPVAVGRALQTFAQIELEAGRDLVGFAAEYVSFQLSFLTSVAAMPFAAVNPSAVSMLAGMTPGPTTAVIHANITTTRPSGDSQATSPPVHTVKPQAKTLRSVVPKSESVTQTTPKAHSEDATDVATGSAGQHQPRHEGGQPKGDSKKR